MKRHNRITHAPLLALCLLAACGSAAQAAAKLQQMASLDADSVQTMDTTSLSTSRTIGALPDGSLPASALVMETHARLLRPAPLPNPDLDAPGPSHDAMAAEDQASLQPNFYSAAKHFSGDGFAAGSTLDGDRANRSKPGGGMSLSIPVQ